MTSPFLACDKQALVSTTAGNTALGVSPVKPPAIVQPRTQVPPLSIVASDLSIQVAEARADIGIKKGDGDQNILRAHRSYAILIGRTTSGMDDGASQPEEFEGPSTGNIPVRRVTLPSSAKHVSRDHAVIFHSPFGSTWAVKILGQNGLLVNGKRKRAGLVLKLTPFETILDFFGVKCLFAGSGSPQDEVVSKARTSPIKNRAQNGRSPSKSVSAAMPKPAIPAVPAHATPGAAISSFHQRAGIVVKRKMLGNPLKRPSGAPPSPPTSSPAPFDHSSPVRMRTGQRKRVLLSSSPMHDTENRNAETASSAGDDDDDDEDDNDVSVSPESPLSSRRGIPQDDSVVMLLAHNSESEASQAIRSEPARHIRIVEVEQEDSEGESELSSSPSPVTKKQEKRVKFTRENNTRDEAGVRSSVPAVRGSALSTSLATLQSIHSHLRELVSRLAETYDLQGLLAEIIVFHRTATISATEAVRAVLSSNPGLLRGEAGPQRSSACNIERGEAISGWSFDNIYQTFLTGANDIDKERIELWQKKAWREKIEACLMEGECFGVISRAGKDASGNPLEYWYYYDKTQDTDVERAANLGALAKPMRAALKTHKPIFWKKSAYGHTADATTSRGDGSLTATESQWGSSGSTLDSLLFSRAARGEEEKSNATSGPQSTIWEETQYEEPERTWDRVGDVDFEMKGKRSRRRR